MIHGIVAAVPKLIATNDDARFVKATGVAQRRVCHKDEESPLLWLARRAVGDLLDGMEGWRPDNLIFVTQTPSVQMPSMSANIAHFIGFHGPAFDVNLACSGYVYGLWLADHLYGRTLLIAGDTVTHMTMDSDAGTRMLFGDCVTASAVQGSYINAVMRTDGSGWGHLIADPSLRMNGPKVFEFATSTVPGLVQETTMNGFVDFHCFHMANQLIIDTIARKLGLAPETVPTNIAKYGNTSSASIPLLLCDSTATPALRERRCRLGLYGFGAGFSAGGILTEIGPLKVLNVAEV